MHLVAFQGLPELVSRLLEDTTAPNTEDWIGFTPLEMAIERDFADVSELLVNCCDINHRSKLKGSTRLMAAVRRGNLAIVQQLLTHRYIEVDVQNFAGNSALDQAMFSGYPQITELLLAHGNIVVNVETTTGKATIHLLAAFGDPKTLQLFLARDDVEINVRDREGRTSIYYAIENVNAEAVRSLLAREDLTIGTENGEVEELISTAEQDRGGFLELLGLDGDHEEIAKLLLSHFRLEQGPVIAS
ncbi:hypothetical protein N7G274_008661 [Stereocaulon virgatum]|uniref:Ankyrin n=1 Tax=Stereocaulon virgatum TaxID=373712 RepID=A0ABR4A0Q1_9LECA